MRYLVKLKPVEPFFFGGEYTFGRDDSRKEASRYSASSTYFPQQTALLGMIRKTLLIQNKNLTMHLKGEWVDSSGKKNGSGDNYHEAIKLTGKGAFSYENATDLGSIQEISPVFITKGDEHYIVNAKDSEYEPTLLKNAKMITSKEQNAFVLQGFKAKEYKEDRFISTTKKELSYGEVFKEVDTVGIKKAKDAEKNDDGFFQKRSYIFKDNAHFSFYLEVKGELKWKNAYITLGADQSSFMLEIAPATDTFDTLFADTFTAKKVSRAVLTSETLLSQEAYEMCHFVFGSRKTYRQLNAKNGKKSKRYYLLERGSVLYTDTLGALVAALSQPHLQRVGINKFIAIKGA